MRGRLGKRAHLGRANDVLKCGGCQQECGAGFGGIVPFAQLVFQIQFGEVAHGFINDGSLGCGVNGALVVVNQAEGGGLAAPGRQRRALNMGPQRGRDFKTDQHVQGLAGDLRVHGVHVEQLRRLNGALQRRLGYFVEHDALGGGNRQAEQAARMIRNAGALAVIVRHEVRFFALRNERPYFFNLGCFRLNDVELGHGGKRGVNVLQ